jgi:hypothetical protein
MYIYTNECIQEFQSGEDDMAFVTAADAETITISNDVITMPDSTPSKQLMSGRNAFIISIMIVNTIFQLLSSISSS